jgi:hypothetical protein
MNMFNFSHMRSIGDRTYTANQKIVDGEVKDELANFKKEWELWEDN